MKSTTCMKIRQKYSSLLIILCIISSCQNGHCANEVETKELLNQVITNTLPGSDSNWPCPTWIEGKNNTIIMSFNYGNKVYISSSIDEGLSWKIISHIDLPTTPPSEAMPNYGGYFTRLSNGDLLLRLCLNDGLKRQSLWITSSDEGKTWSKPTHILKGYGGASPIRVLKDGTWMATGYSIKNGRVNALITSSHDNGKSWREPAIIPGPSDLNKDLSECDFYEVEKNDFVAAVRADESSESWDDFYLTWSADGKNWDAPVSTDERGRMPLFWRIDDDLFLTYRYYSPAQNNQYSAIRHSKDGRFWEDPILIESAVDAAPFIVRINSKVLSFNRKYPQRTQITKHDITSIIKRTKALDSAEKRKRNNLYAKQTVGDKIWICIEPNEINLANQLNFKNLILKSRSLAESRSLVMFYISELGPLKRIVYQLPGDVAFNTMSTYRKRTEEIKALCNKYQNIEGILLGEIDCENTKIQEQLKIMDQLRPRLGNKFNQKLWATISAKELDSKILSQPLVNVNNILLKDVYLENCSELEQKLKKIKLINPNINIFVGLNWDHHYIKSTFKSESINASCTMAIDLLCKKYIEGIVFVCHDFSDEELSWIKKWLAENSPKTL